jgi:hypothetical protein
MNGERPRGILTPADRAYLLGERRYENEQTERNTRGRIRDRIEAATRDFETLIEGLDGHDRELVFGERFGADGGAAAFDALVSSIAFLYLAVGDTDLEFETVLREGINVAEATEDRVASVDLAVTRANRTAEALRRKLELGEELSLTEIAFLQSGDAVSDEELARYLGSERAADIDDGRIQSRVTDF